MLDKLAKSGGLWRLVILLVLSFYSVEIPRAQEVEKGEDPFSAESLELRTALHYDSALGAPLDALVRLYATQSREGELVALYQAHITNYPNDAGAKAVLSRIFTVLDHPDGDAFIETAARQHPEFAHLQYLLSANLKKKDENRSLEALSKAIDLETGKNRRSDWLGELLERSKTEKGRELASAQLKKLLLVEGQTGPTMLSLGQVMLRHQFWELGLEALNRALTANLNPEQKLESNILAAQAEAALGRSVEAGKRLDAVLASLAPDHPRRNEVMSLRVSVIASDEERLGLLFQNRKTYESNPEKETAILDYAEILNVSGNLDEACKILKKGAIDLPESLQIEKLGISLLEKRTNRQDLIDFLEKCLEFHPTRNDLRLRLVKAHYEKDDTLAAEQDFKLVLAGLEGPEKAIRILEMARYLRSTKKTQLAAKYYASFLEAEPSRLDVTRELCEINIEEGFDSKVKEILAKASTKGVEVENLLDLSQFLIDQNYFGQAEVILKEYISGTPILPFEPGLYLARVQSELGRRQEAVTLLQNLREQTDTPARYKSWLNVGLLVSENFDSVDAFFDSEQALFTFPDKDWTIPRIEKFLYLCEAGERRQLTSRVAAAIQQRLGVDSIDKTLKVKLRQLLVKTLEKDPAKADEVEKQLKDLAKEDPDRTNEYDLQLALLYHNLQRPDLATAILERLDLEKVASATLLRDSYKMLIEYGDRKLAGDALAAVTNLEPSDLFSWERRLSLLAGEGNESDLRSAIRSLIQGIAQRGKATEWREDTKQSLQYHLLDSYWRSIADILARGFGLAESLPLLEAAERESQGADLLWINWARAYIYQILGRESEKNIAIDQLLRRLDVAPGAILSFPDGLTISLAAAIEQLKSSSLSGNPPTENKKLPLLGTPKIQWGFEIDEGATILRMGQSNGAIIVLDDRGQVYRIDSESGKLVWKKSLGIPKLPVAQTLSAEGSSHSGVRGPGHFTPSQKVRQLFISGDRFMLAFGTELHAYSCADASLLWKTELPNRPVDPIEPSCGATPLPQFAGEGGTLVFFDPATDSLLGIEAPSGKILWDNTDVSNSKKPFRELVSMNTGISISNGRVLVFGHEAKIYELKTGRPLWGFDGEEVRVFPISLREKREHLSDEEIATLDQIKPKPVWTPITPNGRQHDMSYLSSLPVGEEKIMSFLNYPGSLLAPVVDWAKHRKSTGESAHAEISHSHLWLMDERGLRLISLALPLASREFPIFGTFLGEMESHGWVLNEKGLTHVDGISGDTETFTVDLGDKISGKVIEGRVYLRGSKGVKVYNAVSAKVISRSEWTPEIIAYIEGGKDQKLAGYAWQGPLKRFAPEYPTYCYPINDLVADGRYYTVFGNDRIVSLVD